MKKVLAVVLAAVMMVVLLAGCSSKKELDFKSIRDTKKNVIISLGDDKKTVDKLLGEPEYNQNWGAYIYPNGLEVEYVSAKVSAMASNKNHFEVLGYKDGMSEEKIRLYLDKWEGKTNTYYEAFYDKNGDRCPKELSYVTVFITFEGESFDGFGIWLTK